MSPSHDLPRVDVLTVGTVGPPGQRVFFLQARTPVEQVTLKVEKEQVAMLCQAAVQLLADLPQPDQMPNDLELVEPVQAEWVVGLLALGPYDETTDTINLVVREAVDDDDVAGDEARFGVSRGQLAALARRGLEVVGAGRPPCPLCGAPMDPSGHVCPRSNGHLDR